MKEKATREEVIEFMITEQRSPSPTTQGEEKLCRAFQHYVYYKKDGEIIALKNKFLSNTMKYRGLKLSMALTGKPKGKIDPEKKVSKLTPSEVTKLLKLLRNQTVGELMKKEDPKKGYNKRDVLESVKSSLPKETLKTILNPENEFIITNQNWEVAVKLAEEITESDVLKNNLAAMYVIQQEDFWKEFAIYIMKYPRKRYMDRKDSIIEKIYRCSSPDIRAYKSPERVKDFVESILSV
jgi:hypothetical protein